MNTKIGLYTPPTTPQPPPKQTFWPVLGMVEHWNSVYEYERNLEIYYITQPAHLLHMFLG